MPKPKKPRAWVSTTEAAAALGCEPKYLRENRLKLFKPGTHYRSLNPGAWRPTYRWNLKNLQAFMAALADQPAPPEGDKRSRSAES